MITRKELTSYLDDFLNVANFKDYCPNGLQVEGKNDIGILVSGVSATMELIENAKALHADAILVHHGYFWNNEDHTIYGMKKRRLQALLSADINLFAYHLPLDSHAEIGNNFQLGKLLNIQYTPNTQTHLPLWCGSFATPIKAQGLNQLITEQLGRKPQHFQGRKQYIHSIGWCSGAAQGLIDDAVKLGLDAYLSGEISEQTVHIAKEEGIHYFAAGHHATERLGVQKLGEHLEDVFALQHFFVDIDNPI